MSSEPRPQVLAAEDRILEMNDPVLPSPSARGKSDRGHKLVSLPFFVINNDNNINPGLDFSMRLQMGSGKCATKKKDAKVEKKKKK